VWKRSWSRLPKSVRSNNPLFSQLFVLQKCHVSAAKFTVTDQLLMVFGNFKVHFDCFSLMF
jgi:hypothetical protein